MALGKSPFDGRIARHHNFIVGARPITGPIGKGNGKGNTAGGGHGKGKGGGNVNYRVAGSDVRIAGGDTRIIG